MDVRAEPYVGYEDDVKTWESNPVAAKELDDFCKANPSFEGPFPVDCTKY